MHGTLAKRKGKVIRALYGTILPFFDTRDAQLKTSTVKSTHFFVVVVSFFTALVYF